MEYVKLPKPGGLWKLRSPNNNPKCFEPIWLKMGMLVEVKQLRSTRWFDNGEDRMHRFTLIIGESLAEIICYPHVWSEYMEDITPNE